MSDQTIAQRLSIEYDRLADENRKLREEVARLRGALQGAAQAANIAGAELKRLQREREKLVEGLRTFLAELNRRYKESHHKWETEADLYEQGMAAGFDIAENRLRDILKEIGVEP
ncbi:hypothetical protein [Ferviditalea candida]|uniref:Uncharacterized protein n=1 Tax=Ferviditalea candida TaxID=3108399 RepID=A0ABU5ZKL3_9BACL|nr:hypothetical protein [Paenibacillaceae bacterium T2]